jgi:hypothetical protein
VGTPIDSINQKKKKGYLKRGREEGNTISRMLLFITFKHELVARGIRERAEQHDRANHSSGREE